MITIEGMRLDVRDNGQIVGSDVVRDRWNAGSTAHHLWLPGNPAVCYRLRRSTVHLGNIGSNVRFGPLGRGRRHTGSGNTEEGRLYKNKTVSPKPAKGVCGGYHSPPILSYGKQ